MHGNLLQTTLQMVVLRLKLSNFYQYYSPVVHAYSFIINTAIAAMHRLTTSILYVSNAFHNKNIPIREIVYVSTVHYYLDWFEKYYSNVPLNQNDGSLFIQCMNLIQGGGKIDDNGIGYLMQWLQLLNIMKVQFISPSISRFSVMVQCLILKFLIMMLSTLLIMRHNFLN